MKTFKSLISCILLLATLFTLISCTPEKEAQETTSFADSLPSPETSEETEPETIPVETIPEEDPEREIVFFENGEWTKNVVRSDNRYGSNTSGFSSLCTALKWITDTEPHKGYDYEQGVDVNDPERQEIIYGYTDHKNMQTIYKSMTYGEGKIRVIGNQVYIAAYAPEALKLCRDYFTRMLRENYEDGRIAVKVKDLTADLAFSEIHLRIPTPDGVDFVSYEDCGFDQALAVYRGASPEAFNNYLKKLSDFTLVTSLEDNGNLFATYAIDNHQLNVSYSVGDNRMRVILNENTTPTKLFKKEETTAVTTPLLIMHGLGYQENAQNGICILIRLSDGRFIVVDGGFNRQKDADDLYNLLVKNTPSGMKPTVAAWFITHAHGDHDATFAYKFPNSYKNKVIIENFFFNPPSSTIDESDTDPNYTRYNSIFNAAKSFSGCQIIRPHVGDKYYIGDAEIDMLYTVDNQYPITFNYYNTCSIIFSVKIAGQRIMITGDGANASFDKVVAMYGETLKCDIVQVAHHGYGTGVSDSASTAIMEGYKYMSPSLVLWPIGKIGYESVKSKPYNVVLSQLPSVKEIVVAESSDHIFPLPYTPS